MYEEEDQVSLFGPDSWSGKTSPEPSAATREKILPPSWKKPSVSRSQTRPLCLCLRGGGQGADACTMKWEDGALLGEFTTRSFGASPSVGRESLLSQILEECPHPKYRLSAKACVGILKRAKRRKKDLPQVVETALKTQICAELLNRAEEAGKIPLPVLVRMIFALNQEARMGYCEYTKTEYPQRLTPHRGGQRQPCVINSVYPDIANTLTRRCDGSPQPDKGNGDGKTVCTITGDHENRVTDYTAICIGNGQTDNISMAEQTNTLDTMHDQQMVMIAAVDCRNGTENPTTNGTLQAKPTGGYSINYQNTVRVCDTVRRLTPLECERLQGYPSKKMWDVSKMTKDEYIAWSIAEGNIVVDPRAGKVYGTRGPGGVPYKKPKELAGTNVSGYLVVSIRNGATKLSCRVHRVVWISQNGVIPDGYVVDHINNNKQDNRIENLQLLTAAQNSTKAKEDGLYATGFENKATKIDPDLKDEIAYLYEFSDMTYRELVKIYGVSKSRIHQIVKEVGWTDIGEWTDSKGKKRKTSDAARYKALGNSIALPYWFWLLRRISALYERPATLGSLFDGIGGFPLCWERCNGKGTALWASEIEEFPIAVTKHWFGED